MFQGHRGASEGFRAGPMGRDKAQSGGGGGTGGAEAESGEGGRGASRELATRP